MVKIKKRASKRTSVKQREKVKKRVNEHHRKTRKEAKKSVEWKSRVKKDPGIPNSYPYKEQLLEEIQQKRQAAEEAKLKAREAAKGKSAQELSDVEDEKSDQDVDVRDQEAAAPRASKVAEYSGSVQALLEDDTCAAILLAVDARDPLSWTLPWLQERAKASSKVLLHVLTKSDLVPLEVLSQWTRAVSATGPVFAVSCAAGARAGIAPLLEHLTQLIGADRAAAAKVVVCGLENSGRTTLAQALQQQAHDTLKILDSPELIAADASSEPATDARRSLVRNKGPLQRIKDPMPLVHALLSKIESPSDLQLVYSIPAFPTPSQDQSDYPEQAANSFLLGLARARGRLRKHDLPDTHGAARLLLRDWSAGELMYYSRAPPSTTKQSDSAVADVAAALASACLPRRAWREKWAAKEVRLKHQPLDGQTGSAELLFATKRTRVAFAEQGDGDSAADLEDAEVSNDDNSDTSGDDEGEDAGEDGSEPSATSNALQQPKAQRLSKRKADAADKNQNAKRPQTQPGQKYQFSDHF